MNSASYEIATFFRLFVLKELYECEHETAPLEYLERQSDIRKQLGFESVPNQLTLWWYRHTHFSVNLRETIGTTARTNPINALNAGVTVPREPDRKLRHKDTEANQSDPDNGAVLERVNEIIDRVSRIIFPAFLLVVVKVVGIHEIVYWDLQTHLDLRENLAATRNHNFIDESTRDCPSHGHAYREHLRSLPTKQIREIYRQAVVRGCHTTVHTSIFHYSQSVGIGNG